MLRLGNVGDMLYQLNVVFVRLVITQRHLRASFYARHETNQHGPRVGQKMPASWPTVTHQLRKSRKSWRTELPAQKVPLPHSSEGCEPNDVRAIRSYKAANASVYGLRAREC